MTHLWTMETPDPVLRLRTEASDGWRQIQRGRIFSWSRGTGRRIAFSAQKDPDLISSETADLYLVTANDAR